MTNWKDIEFRSSSFRRAIVKGVAALALAAIAITPFASAASAQPLLDKIKNGEPIRIGFSNEVPLAYSGPNGEPLGAINEMTLDILKQLGTTKIEPVVTEWGSIIPGLVAGRFDIITGGMFVTPERCRNVLFTEPLMSGTSAMIVPKGNPDNLHSIQDVRDKGLTLVTGSGWTLVKDAKTVGVPEDKIMQVAGVAEVLQAVKSGRAAAGAGSVLAMKEIADKDPSVQLAEPFTQPVLPGLGALAFPPDQQATVDAVNAVLKDYVKSDRMISVLEKYGYSKAVLPDGRTTAELCKG
ncbi:ectoine/hydroxyectoine ABC transporter substrate-binding protein EhuB [Ensifer aridi]|uniref:ectoine/hydroxyectoine ABC transporter substrate-binding protein EhuB n=1 Tax=Ensifer aridi TaxID=1708715 RepID=UPI00358E07EB